MQIKRLTGEDRTQLERFFDRVPDADRDFLKEDLDDPGLIYRWLSGRRGRWLLGVDDGGVAGLVGLLPRTGRSGHVGELCLLVDPARRRRGYGCALARAALVEAFELGLTHIFVEVGAEQEALITMFGALGFEPEALLRDFVRDQGGSSRDLVVLTHRLEELWSEMLTLGLAEEQPVR
jgi:RimJ/RimL family protein N-acetyltransferase